MQRRQFLKLASCCSLAAGLPALYRTSRAQSATFGGPYWLMVHAAGGWDPRLLFDPSPNRDQNRYATEVGAIGNISFADFPVDLGRFGLAAGQGYEARLLSNREFLSRHGSRLTVINGIDTATNNHEAGTRAIWSGRLLGEYPALGALVAAAGAPDQPMAFLSGGGYDVTGGVVPLTRAENPDVLAKLRLPNRVDPSSAEVRDNFHTDATFERIRSARAARLERLRTRASLPRERAAMTDLARARAASSALSRLELPELVEIPGYDLDDLERLLRSTQIALAAFKSGIAAAANVTLTGFDTHSDHDAKHPLQIAKLLYGLDFLFREADALGLTPRLYVLVSSDFARGPIYNSDRESAGKDHWPVTSLLAAGPTIAGDRVLGATTSEQHARPLDPRTLTPSASGVRLTPELVHAALRRTAGVAGYEDRYPLAGPVLSLFE